MLEINRDLVSRQCHSRANRGEVPGPSYVYSPLNSGESDVDLSDTDPTYNKDDLPNKLPKLIPDSSSSGSASSSSSSTSDSDSSSTQHSASDDSLRQEVTKKRGRKKTRDTESWKQNKAQKLRNSGKPYTSISASCKSFSGRSIKASCTAKCRLQCSENIDEASRLSQFNAFWNLADLYKQRAFIGSCMADVQPKYRYTNAENPRSYNKAYYLTIDSKRIRVCKLFFKNTLGITDRMIQTTKSKYDVNGIVLEDFRGKHENHKKIPAELVSDIREHIKSIPRIESHYLRNNSVREYYIDGSKTITDLYKDFKNHQAERGREAGKYCSYYKIFTTQFNIGFHQPKKDLCDLCMTFDNTSAEQK